MIYRYLGSIHGLMVMTATSIYGGGRYYVADNDAPGGWRRIR